jgi:hypothetical protein
LPQWTPDRAELAKRNPNGQRRVAIGSGLYHVHTVSDFRPQLPDTLIDPVGR